MIGMTGTIITITMIMTITAISTIIMAVEDVARRAIVAAWDTEAIQISAEAVTAGEPTGKRMLRETVPVRVIVIRVIRLVIQAIQDTGRIIQTVFHGMKRDSEVIRWKSVPD
jgi:hypothetical protein